MSENKYRNFVRETNSQTTSGSELRGSYYLSGSDARRIYLDVVSKPTVSHSGQLSPISIPTSSIHARIATKQTLKNPETLAIKNDSQLFNATQNDQHTAVKSYLTDHPDKINIVDTFGWSLLMIACQANAINSVKVLLELNIDKFIRDKAGNSANTIAINQHNKEIVNLLLNHKARSTGKKYKMRTPVVNDSELLYHCSLCNRKFNDEKEHLKSTIHNMNLSKGKKLKAWYSIPESNLGYQILVKSGWDRDSGLGPGGEGKKYPIKPSMKQDRKGLGFIKRKLEEMKSDIKQGQTDSKLNFRREKAMEINFRREFYDF